MGLARAGCRAGLLCAYPFGRSSTAPRRSGLAPAGDRLRRAAQLGVAASAFDDVLGVGERLRSAVLLAGPGGPGGPRTSPAADGGTEVSWPVRWPG